MDSGLKWIGGATLAVVALFGGATLAGHVLAAQDAAPRVAAGDVLDFGQDDAAPRLADAIPAAAPAQPASAAAPAAASSPAPPKVSSANPLVIKRVLQIDGPIRYGQWFWNDKDVPAGPLVMTVDLDARVLSVFRDGYEIGAAAVLLGTDEHPTPTGVFPILTKERHNISEKYNNAPMPWTMRLTWDGVAIHGGSTVENGYASHGCISAPDAFVSKIYALARTGDIVIITRGRMTGVGGSLASS